MRKSKLLLAILMFANMVLVIGCNEGLDLSDFSGGSGKVNLGGDTVYIPIQPEWKGFNKPQDILMGKETFLYVADTDNDRIVVLDLNGQVIGTRAVKRPVALAQDYQLNLIVCASFDTTIGGALKTFSAVYKFDMVAAGHHIETAPITRLLPRPGFSADLQYPDRKYTGVCAFYDNSFYVSRTGPSNGSIIDPDNSILIFQKKTSATGVKSDTLIGRLPLLDPQGSGLMAANGVSALTSLNRRSMDFIMTMKGDNSFKTQWLSYLVTSEFAGYVSKFSPSNSEMLKPNRFLRPEGITLDYSGNIYVADAGKDSIYKFNQFGDAILGFGGASVFNQPHAVAHFDRTLYVADTYNNRILRFVLSTEIR